MKLTNISLAILVAIGLVACGGSDDKNNQTTDNNNAGNHNTGNNNPPPPPPKKEVEDPDNRASALEVEARLAPNVAVDKTVYANSNGLDTLAGYSNGVRFDPGSVDTADIKRTPSIVNYLQAGWVNNAANGGNIRLNPLQTYAKGASGAFYRVVGIYSPGVGGGAPQPKAWADATPTDLFAVSADLTAAPLSNVTFASEFANPNAIPASNLYYIPNVMTLGGDGVTNLTSFLPTTVAGGAPSMVVTTTTVSSLNNATNPNGIVLGSAINPGVNALKAATDGTTTLDQNSNSFDLSREDVVYSTLKVGNKSYNVGGSSAGGSFKLDLGLDNKEDIQNVPIKLGYNIVDNKGTVSGQDNDVISREVEAGELRVYNINYSLSLLEVNNAAAKDSNDLNAEARNGLGFQGSAVRGAIYGFGNVSGSGYNGRYGPFQVQGYQTSALPLNGRATYKGQSFGVNSKGVINLDVDFGEDRAGIKGSVTERTSIDGKNKLDDMRLNPIILSQPGQYSQTGSIGMSPNNNRVNNGIVDLGGASNWGTWAVQLYGPNAENAAGVIAQGAAQLRSGDAAAASATAVGPLQNVVEVFNSARTDINPKSLNNPKNP